MKRVLKWVDEMRLLADYRRGEFLSAYLLNKLYNMWIIWGLVAISSVIHIFTVGYDKLFDGSMKSIAVLIFCLITILYGFIFPVYINYATHSSKMGHSIIYSFVFLCLSAEVLFIRNEIINVGTPYNYIVLMFVLSSIANFTLKENLGILLSLNAVLLLACWNDLECCELQGTVEHGYYVRSMVIIILVSFAVAFRNHANYLRTVKDKHTLSKVGETDLLTTLLNRRGLAQCIKRRGYQNNIAVCMLDIDDFKAYNDTYGHDKGDYCLQKVSSCLQILEQKHDAVCIRHGGEEFVIVFFGEVYEEIKQSLQHCLEEIRRLKIKSGVGATLPYVTVSMGLAFRETGVMSLEQYNEVIAQADCKLYQAKQKGKDQLVSEETIRAVKN